MALRPRAGWAALAAVLLAGCARVLPPPGGPLDTTAPAVTAVSPESLAVGVPVDTVITVTFSEKVERSTLERALWVAPGGTSKPRFDVSGETVVIHPGRAFPESATVGVLLTTVITDRKRENTANAMPEPYRWIFSTGDRLWPGRVSGKVETVTRGGSGTARGQVLVGLYPGAADTVPDPSTTEPEAVTQARADGRYVLDGLRTDGRRRWLIAMLDLDGNRVISGSGEFVSASPESLVLTPGGSEATMALRLVDPEAPGEVTGSFTRSPEDSTARWVELFGTGADSAEVKAKVRVGDDGAYDVKNVPPGTYRLAAFCDGNRNGRKDREEAETFYDGPVIVHPAGKQELPPRPAPVCAG